MFKKSKKNNTSLPSEGEQKPVRSFSDISDASKKKALDIIAFIIITVVVVSVYIFFVQIWQFKTVFIVYLSIWSASVLAYCFYNRGILQKDLTKDQLSPYWTDEKKEQFLNSIKVRRKRSRWLLFIIAPFTFVMIMELFMVFVLPQITSYFS